MDTAGADVPLAGGAACPSAAPAPAPRPIPDRLGLSPVAAPLLHTPAAHWGAAASAAGASPAAGCEDIDIDAPAEAEGSEEEEREEERAASGRQQEGGQLLVGANTGGLRGEEEWGGAVLTDSDWEGDDSYGTQTPSQDSGAWADEPLQPSGPGGALGGNGAADSATPTPPLGGQHSVRADAGKAGAAVDCPSEPHGGSEAAEYLDNGEDAARIRMFAFLRDAQTELRARWASVDRAKCARLLAMIGPIEGEACRWRVVSDRVRPGRWIFYAPGSAVDDAELWPGRLTAAGRAAPCLRTNVRRKPWKHQFMHGGRFVESLVEVLERLDSHVAAGYVVLDPRYSSAEANAATDEPPSEAAARQCAFLRSAQAELRARWASADPAKCARLLAMIGPIEGEACRWTTDHDASRAHRWVHRAPGSGADDAALWPGRLTAAGRRALSLSTHKARAPWMHRFADINSYMKRLADALERLDAHVAAGYVVLDPRYGGSGRGAGGRAATAAGSLPVKRKPGCRGSAGAGRGAKRRARAAADSGSDAESDGDSDSDAPSDEEEDAPAARSGAKTTQAPRPLSAAPAAAPALEPPGEVSAADAAWIAKSLQRVRQQLRDANAPPLLARLLGPEGRHPAELGWRRLQSGGERFNSCLVAPANWPGRLTAAGDAELPRRARWSESQRWQTRIRVADVIAALERMADYATHGLIDLELEYGGTPWVAAAAPPKRAGPYPGIAAVAAGPASARQAAPPVKSEASPPRPRMPSQMTSSGDGRAAPAAVLPPTTIALAPAMAPTPAPALAPAAAPAPESGPDPAASLAQARAALRARVVARYRAGAISEAEYHSLLDTLL